ncbi:MAG TPA: hypothetical protein VHO69_03530 [Phototrophicaceae bacterium]|nr:hypothetical protein [Phototrophicaceae bacterium]
MTDQQLTLDEQNLLRLLQRLKAQIILIEKQQTDYLIQLPDDSLGIVQDVCLLPDGKHQITYRCGQQIEVIETDGSDAKFYRFNAPKWEFEYQRTEIEWPEVISFGSWRAYDGQK